MTEHGPDMGPYNRLIVRINRTGVCRDELGLDAQLDLLEHSFRVGQPDREQYEIIMSTIEELENQLLMSPFLPPMAALPEGDVHIGDTATGPLKVSIGSGAGQQAESHPINHTLVIAQVYGGKTFTIAHLAGQLTVAADVILLESRNQFSQFPKLRRFDFVPIRSLRFNPFDEIKNLAPNEQRLTLIRGMAATFSWQLAESEVNEAAKELAEKSNLNICSLCEHLKAKTYRFNTNRGRFRDTAVLTLSRLIDGTHPLLNCQTGMPLLSILSGGSRVLDLSSLGVEQQSYLIRMVFDLVYLHCRAGTRLMRPLVMFIDEAQKILQRPEVPEMLLTLRHSNVYVVMCVQHPSLLPREAFNVDLILVMRLTDARDKDAVAKALNLNREQAAYQLPDRQAVFFLPRVLRRAAIVEIPFVQSGSIQSMEPAAFIQELPWTPREEPAPPEKASKLGDIDAERFLLDVLTESLQESPLIQRFQRVNIRSSSKRGAVMKKLIGEGWIKTWKLAAGGRGRPWTLVEPTEKAFEAFGVSWKKTRGNLPTRVATKLLRKKLQKIEGWNVTSEGLVNGKQVDLVGRNPAGELYCFEIAGNAKHEVANALIVLKQAEVKKLFVIATSVDIRDEVVRRFAEFPEIANDKRGNVMTLSEALSDTWMP